MSQELVQKQLDTLSGDLQAFIAKQKEEIAKFGTTLKETADNIEKVIAKQNELDQKLASSASRVETKSFRERLEQQDAVQKLMRNERGRFHVKLSGDDLKQLEIELKTTMTSTTIGYQTPGVMPAERGRYVQEARPELRMRDILPVRSTNLQHLYWPKFSVTGTKASPVAEAAAKPINTYDPTTAEQKVKTIATYMKASRQSLEDWSEFQGILTNLLGHKVAKEEDTQVLFGDNTGENLNGVTTQAQAWDLTVLPPSSGYEYADIIGGACSQIAQDNELPPNFVVLHPRDVWRIRLKKDNEKRYIFGNPDMPGPTNMWGLQVVATTQMTAGYFLVGSGSPVASEIRERMGVEIMISTENEDDFIKNLVTIRSESRLAYCCYRPDAFVYGALTTSPA